MNKGETDMKNYNPLGNTKYIPSKYDKYTFPPGTRWPMLGAKVNESKAKRNRAIIDLSNSGVETNKVAKLFGLSSSTISNIKKEYRDERT